LSAACGLEFLLVSARVRWLVWTLFTIAWTVALLLPRPPVDTRSLDVQISSAQEPVLPFGKLVHLAAYAVFAMLSGWLRVRRRWLLLGFLLAHATLTEYAQTLLPTGRSGQWRDVAFNGAGIVLGVLLTSRWWRKTAAFENCASIATQDNAGRLS